MAFLLKKKPMAKTTLLRGKNYKVVAVLTLKAQNPKVLHLPDHVRFLSIT